MVGAGGRVVLGDAAPDGDRVGARPRAMVETWTRLGPGVRMGTGIEARLVGTVPVDACSAQGDGDCANEGTA